MIGAKELKTLIMINCKEMINYEKFEKNDNHIDVSIANLCFIR